MTISRRQFLPVLSSPLLACAADARADEFPSKPVRIIVPYSTGGSTDVLSRLLGPRLSEVLGTPVFVENRPGGSSTIGVDLVAKSTDMHTFGIVNIAFVATPSLMKKLPYNPERDLVPISQLATASLVMVVHPSVKARSLKELIAFSKTTQGLFYASAGVGAGNHLFAERLKYTTGLKMDHVPYKGGGPSVLGVVSGEAQMLIASIHSVAQHIQAGKLVPLAVGRARRDDLLPDVPTFSELIPDFEANDWIGMVAPAGTPTAVIQRVHAAISKSLAVPEVRARLYVSGLVSVGSAPREFSAFLKKENLIWSKVIKEVGITVD